MMVTAILLTETSKTQIRKILEKIAVVQRVLINVSASLATRWERLSFTLLLIKVKLSGLFVCIQFNGRHTPISPAQVCFACSCYHAQSSTNEES